MCEADSISWINQSKKLLRQYNLPSIFALLNSTPSKAEWKTTVKKAVMEFWEKELKEAAQNKSSLQYLNLNKCSLRKVHPVWGSNLTDPLAIQRATVKAQLLVMRYPLTAYSVSGKRKSLLCPLCHQEPETVPHFLLFCPSLSPSRQPWITPILDHLRKLQLCLTSLVSFILDPPTTNPQVAMELENITRNYCYRLHRQRQYLLDEKRQEKVPHYH